MKWYFYVIIAGIIIVIVLFALIEVMKKKKVYQRILDCQYRAGKKRYEIIDARKKEYDFVYNYLYYSATSYLSFSNL